MGLETDNGSLYDKNLTCACDRRKAFVIDKSACSSLTVLFLISYLLLSIFSNYRAGKPEFLAVSVQGRVSKIKTCNKKK